MKKSWLRVLTLITTLLFILTGAIGCEKSQKTTPAKKPATVRKTVTQPQKKPVTSTITATEADRIAKCLAQEAVKVKGVNKAYVVIDTTGAKPNAYVGVNLTPDVKGAQTDKVKKEVEKKLKSAEPRLSTVNVTSDPDLVKRIRDLASAIAKGRPISGFADEIKELARRIKPTSR
ncbi:MAG TPA: YhcN/YlaJ family sporulation lipoprotein [Syntrophothermus lipocalidus]|uniref:Sporulation lipoprotein, YhcN/YlaJ family n=1 Tax=Syntrophothermus lipocalidus (strain DSM 12680 / TGB-C1) TaxID=643648 RepID=D7CNI9_SYNLT|nr:YhcN/YlaJ family sporulation lipoprotein [Syntrophothermus lipocalidus]ADI02274.1 sporulation lipoprotein, YhcN/YlaJ family [Syntrophothermus lipocalidus DSM 12680]HHV75885.1 YhcN/YlaJ family sporulation lipoprotein [Syntrophothermus lipocalidus]HOV43607.1 YhcN/YlaJ family sporulation lipoprotein [Syntrophothermus lipocalidus]